MNDEEVNSNSQENDDEDELNDERLFCERGYTDLDHKEIYLKLIFEPFRFSKTNIIKSLGV